MNLAAMALLLAATAVTPPEVPLSGLPLTGDEAIDFLSSAEVEGPVEEFDDLAMTDPVRVTLIRDPLAVGRGWRTMRMDRAC